MNLSCKWCAKPLPIGAEAIELDNYAEGLYCCKECAENALEQEIESILEDNSTDVTIEAEDPYDRYGVNRSDF